MDVRLEYCFHVHNIRLGTVWWFSKIFWIFIAIFNIFNFFWGFYSKFDALDVLLLVSLCSKFLFFFCFFDYLCSFHRSSNFSITPNKWISINAVSVRFRCSLNNSCQFRFHFPNIIFFLQNSIFEFFATFLAF